MSKRKVHFSEPPKFDDESGGKKKNPRIRTENIDQSERDKADYDDDLEESGSDGEINEEGNALNMEEIEGVEEKTVEHDEEVKITPFNLDEEMEDGHFDKDGTFVFNKKDNIKDSWLDEFDFNDVRQIESARLAVEKRQTKQAVTEESSDEQLSEVEIYRQILSTIQPGENVLKAVRRLGNATRSLSASERLKLKKQAAKQTNQGGIASLPINVDEQKKQLSRLTELADLLIRRGHMNAYEETFESLNFMIKQLTKESPKKNLPASDMFGDDFAEEVGQNSAKTSDADRQTNSPDNEVKWEYKMSHEESGDIRGPVLTSVLLDMIAENEKDGKQPSTFYVRRHGSTGQFYSSGRVDFSLYTD